MSQITGMPELVAVVDSAEPGIEVARAIRRALARAGRKAAEVETVVVGGELDAAATADALATVERGLGRFAANANVVWTDNVDAALLQATGGCVLAVIFRTDGCATVNAYSRRRART